MNAIAQLPWHQIGPYLVPLLVLGILVRRSLRGRRVRTGRMWSFPVVLLALTAITMAREPMPGLIAIAGFTASAIAGAGIGYLRARHQELSMDATGQVISKATPLGVILIVGFFVLRYGLEFVTHTRDIPHAIGLQRATDAGLIFSVAMMFASRWEIWRRARPLLSGYRTDREIPPPSAEPGP